MFELDGMESKMLMKRAVFRGHYDFSLSDFRSTNPETKLNAAGNPPV